MVFRHSFANVAPSNYLKKAFFERGFHNTIFIPNVLEINQYDFLERKSFHANLLWVRAFDKIYNPQMAIDVLKLLQKKYPSTSLSMIGPDRDGSLEKTKQYAKNQKVEVVFTGKLSKSEWTLLAAKHDFFINTTHIDNTPVSVLEAMALGLSVVSTNVGGIPFLIEDQKEGMLVNDNDALAMANKIEFLIQNPILANQLVHSARIKVEQFDWEQVKVLWNNLLQ
jgi:L-malate glycosyltransferase